MVCLEYNCLFVHVPKTAGQSIEQFFMDRLGLDWATDRERLLLQANDDPAKGTEKLAHLSAAEYVRCGHVSQAEYDRLYSFSFVRNPYQRLVSEYLYRNYFHHRSFADFVLNKLPQPGWDDKYRHVMPQYDMLHGPDGQLLVDFVGRFENLQTDFDRVCGKLGIPESTLPHRNPSDKASRNIRRRIRNLIWFNGENAKTHWSEYYDWRTRAAVSELYRDDLETFGYSFHGRAGAGQ